MNTTKSIYNRLFKEQAVELASHEVHLGTIDEIANALKFISQTNDKFNKLDATVQKNVKPLNDAYKQIVINKDYAKKTTGMLDKLQATLTKQASDLGVDVKQLPAFKQLMDAYEFADQVNDSIMNAMDAVKNIGK
jgi:hypothetical protein